MAFTRKWVEAGEDGEGTRKWMYMTVSVRSVSDKL